MIGKILILLIASRAASAFDWQHGDTAASRQEAAHEEAAKVLGGLAVVLLWLLERCL